MHGPGGKALVVVRGDAVGGGEGAMVVGVGSLSGGRGADLAPTIPFDRRSTAAIRMHLPIAACGQKQPVTVTFHLHADGVRLC